MIEGTMEKDGRMNKENFQSVVLWIHPRVHIYISQEDKVSVF